jgi:hypothetical protein
MYSNSEFNRWRRHPWHGLHVRADDAPKDIVQVYIEMTPSDVVKYELDKASGFLMVDRPQRTTSSPPALYGFIPRTYCAEEVAKRCPGVEVADGDPLDICLRETTSGAMCTTSLTCQRSKPSACSITFLPTKWFQAKRTTLRWTLSMVARKP